MKNLKRASVIVASTSAAEGTATDTTGGIIAEWLEERGFSVTGPLVVADGHPVRFAVDAELATRSDLVLITGGTGVSPDDQTPEMVEPLLEIKLPGIIEAIRRKGEASTPLAAITRGVAGFAHKTLVVTLPGSTGGVRDGLEVLDPLVDHLLAQRRGQGSHGPRG